MSGFTPTVPIALQIRKIIFEKFNNVDTNFTNDDVFEMLKINGDLDPSWIIDDTESLFSDLCNSGLARNIAQNFTTIYLKLFDLMEKLHCDACDNDVYLGTSEERICPNTDCRSSI
ncbi:MAG TPA: hypothetical protein VIS47_00950 [Nitrosopumilus sp.]